MDRYWTAVDAIFALPALAGKRSVLLSYVHRDQQAIDWPGLDAEIGPWSHGEQLLVRIAHSLYNGDAAVMIDEFSVLAPPTLRQVLGIIERFYA